MQSLKLLIIGYVWPEPKSSAAGTHMMQLIEFFQSEDYQIIFASPAQQGENRALLTSIGIQEKNIALNCSSFDQWIQEIKPDIVLFDRFMMEEQFGWRVAQYCPQAIRILETSDLHCLREARKQLLKQNPNTVVEVSESELYTIMASLEITQREIASIFRCDASLFVSDFEINFLHTLFKIPLDLMWYCPFMMDIPNKSSFPDFDQRKNFITIGNFLHA
ncbi:MAG: glycosyltransferase, partial [Pseudomonadota bacterium]